MTDEIFEFFTIFGCSTKLFREKETLSIATNQWNVVRYIGFPYSLVFLDISCRLVTDILLRWFLSYITGLATSPAVNYALVPQGLSSFDMEITLLRNFHRYLLRKVLFPCAGVG